tara:strand:+ start:386 stop:1120 length:735 start_codon:yes stop_codon:yes gene_type:complete
MKLKRENKVKILEYKFIFEEEIQVSKEYQEGSADLSYRLSFFREKLDNKGLNSNQIKIYDEMLIGKKQEYPLKDLEVQNNIEQELSKSAEKAHNVKAWAKKMYKKIVMVTHPDKTKGIQSKNLVSQLTEQYRIAQKSYTSGIYSDLIMVAFDLNIDIPENVVDAEITPVCKNKKDLILNTKRMLGWKWYHVPEKQRDAELKKILVNLGFKFTEEQIKDVIKRKYVKRKTGTRPEKINVKRRKLK